MFWKKEEQAKKQEEPAAEKPCCSGQKQPPEERQSVVKEALSQGVSTFEFGGSAASGVKLVGDCQGSDPNAIQACRWSPTPGPATRHTILF